MPSTPFKPENSPTLIPYLTVRDGQKSINFYQAAFGFTLLNDPSYDEKGCIQHVEMKFLDVIIMFACEGAFKSPVKSPVSNNVFPSVTLYLYCEDVDKLYERALREGAQSIVKPTDGFWGDRFCQVLDIDGHS